MKGFRTIFEGIDYTLQLMLVSTTGLCALLTAFEQEAIFFYLLALLFTGSWQLFSAAVGGIIFKQERKLLYMACSLLYCVMLYFGISKGWHFLDSTYPLAVGFVCVLPTIAAGVYFWMNLQEEPKPKMEEYV